MNNKFRPIKVLYLSLFADSMRGGQRSLLLLLRALNRKKVLPHVIVPDSGPLISELDEIGIPSSVVHIPRSIIKNPLGSVRALGELKQLVKKIDPDIVHADAPRNAHLISLVSGKAKRIIHLRVATPDGLSDRILAARMDALIAVSHGTAERFMYYPADIREKVHVIHNAAETDRFRPFSKRKIANLRKGLNLSEESPAVAMLGAFVPFKRHEFLINLWPEVLKRVPNAKLVLAGRDEDGKRDRMKKLVADLKINHSVDFLPFTDTPEDILNACDLLALPSSDTREEGFPRLVVEAGACGSPALATDGVGIREGVDHGKTGYLISEKDSEAWVDRFTELLEDKAKREKMGIAARAWVVKHFSAQTHADKVMDLYSQLLK